MDHALRATERRVLSAGRAAPLLRLMAAIPTAPFASFAGASGIRFRPGSSILGHGDFAAARRSSLSCSEGFSWFLHSREPPVFNRKSKLGRRAAALCRIFAPHRKFSSGVPHSLTHPGYMISAVPSSHVAHAPHHSRAGPLPKLFPKKISPLRRKSKTHR